MTSYLLPHFLHLNSYSGISKLLQGGENGSNPDNIPNLSEVRLEEWRKAGQLFGATRMHYLGYIDGRLDNQALLEIAEKIEQIVTDTLKDQYLEVIVDFIRILWLVGNRHGRIPGHRVISIAFLVNTLSLGTADFCSGDDIQPVNISEDVRIIQLSPGRVVGVVGLGLQDRTVGFSAVECFQRCAVDKGGIGINAVNLIAFIVDEGIGHETVDAELG